MAGFLSLALPAYQGIQISQKDCLAIVRNLLGSLLPDFCFSHSMKEKGCRNMSGHALMGRPAARLEMMVLVFRSYVLVCVISKRR